MRRNLPIWSHRVNAAPTSTLRRTCKRPASLATPVVGAILVLSIAPSATAQGGDQRAGWYVSGGGGTNWTSEIEQSGFNRDPLCYPTDACFDQDARPEFPGYRWAYDLESAGGAVARLPPGGTATSKSESDEPDAAIRVNTWQPAPYPLIIIEVLLSTQAIPAPTCSGSCTPQLPDQRRSR